MNCVSPLRYLVINLLVFAGTAMSAYFTMLSTIFYIVLAAFLLVGFWTLNFPIGRTESIVANVEIVALLTDANGELAEPIREGGHNSQAIGYLSTFEDNLALYSASKRNTIKHYFENYLGCEIAVDSFVRSVPDDRLDDLSEFISDISNKLESSKKEVPAPIFQNVRLRRIE